MKLVNVLELKSKMVLAQDVMAANGRLLIAKGAALDKKYLRIMNIWGITEAWVHDYDESVPADATENASGFEPYEKAKQYADRFFIGHNMKQAETAELYRLKVMDLMGQVNDGWKPHSEQVIIDEPVETVAESEPDSISALLAGNFDLGSIPDIYFRLNEVLDDVSSSGAHIAEVISRDQGISARLLKIVNSPVYGRAGKIDSLKDGVFLVGTRALSELVLCMSLIDRFKKIPESIITPRQMWTHSIACGVIARILASYLNHLNPDRCFVAGLLHDIGKLIMATQMPQKIKGISLLARTKRIPYVQAERMMLGWDHAGVVSELFRIWNFPPELRDIVGFHHDPDAAPGNGAASVVHIADVISIVWEYGSGILPVAPLISPKAWEMLGLPKSVLATTISKAKRQIEEMANIFLE